jgi:integrase/recombinase XerD
VTHLKKLMLEELVRRDYAESTIRSCLHTLEDLRRYAQKRLDHLGPDDIRHYQVYLRAERKLDIGTASNYVAALRCFYVKTLKRPSVKEDLPYPHGVKRKRRLPTILSQEEVGRLIDSSKNLFQYAMLLAMYSAGLPAASFKSPYRKCFGPSISCSRQFSPRHSRSRLTTTREIGRETSPVRSSTR